MVSSRIQVAIFAILVPSLLFADDKTEPKNQGNHYIKAELGGELQSWPGGVVLNKPVLLVDRIHWQLHIDEKNNAAGSWKKLVGKTVIVTGFLEIRPNEPTKTSKGIVGQTNYYVNVKTLKARPMKKGKKQ